MNKYVVTGWTYTTVLVGDTEIAGTDVLLGECEGETKEEVLERVAEQYQVPVDELTAYQVL